MNEETHSFSFTYSFTPSLNIHRAPTLPKPQGQTQRWEHGASCPAPSQLPHLLGAHPPPCPLSRTACTVSVPVCFVLAHLTAPESSFQKASLVMSAMGVLLSTCALFSVIGILFCKRAHFFFFNLASFQATSSMDVS